MKRINIMTSCDSNLSMYIFPQLVSIAKNLRDFDVRFYLAHSRIKANDIRILKKFAEGLRNQRDMGKLAFFEAKVGNDEFYDRIAKGGWWQWPREAYYALRVQDFLPDDVDRVLYIDAGDVIIDGDISPYYFDDFEGNSIIGTPLDFKKDQATGKLGLYTQGDIAKVAKSCIFNSGSYVIDVEKFRKDGYTCDDYLYLSDTLQGCAEPHALSYMGDQGFLAAAFVGDIKIFGYPEHKDPSYMPYNFRSSYWSLFEKKDPPPYKPKVLHWAIISKPWVVRFSEEYISAVIDSPDFVSNRLVVEIPPIIHMTAEHLRLGEVWWQYAKETPIYEEANLRARVTADTWARHFLPTCEEYNDMALTLRAQDTGANQQ